jgi:plastocyanin
MITQPAKLFLPLSVLGAVAAIFYGAFTGDHAGVTMFLGLATVALFGGIAITLARQNEFVPARAPSGADAEASAEAPTFRPAPAARVPGGSGWPALAGLGIGLVVLAFILGPHYAIAGVGLGLVGGVGWLGSVANDRTGRSPNLMPLGIPVVGLFAIGSLMFFMSRILLAVPEQASTFIALAVAALILALASVVALKPDISSRAVMAGLVVGGLLMMGGGLVAAAFGPREVEPHGEHTGRAGVHIAARDVKFDEEEFELHANQPAVIEFDNKEAQPHNVAIYTGEDFVQPVWQGDVIVGPGRIEYRFTAPGAGTYYFRCDIHPSMKGKVHVE